MNCCQHPHPPPPRFNRKINMLTLLLQKLKKLKNDPISRYRRMACTALAHLNVIIQSSIQLKYTTVAFLTYEMKTE